MPDARTWELRASDTLNERARKLAEIALADTVHNALVVETILPRAILRMQDALAKYAEQDLQKSQGER